MHKIKKVFNGKIPILECEKYFLLITLLADNWNVINTNVKPKVFRETSEMRLKVIPEVDCGLKLRNLAV